MADPQVVKSAALVRFAADLLGAAGFPGDVAEQAAEVLVWADLRGHASHGVMRLPTYVAWTAKGIIDPAAKPSVTRSKGAVEVIDAARALGPWALTMAADAAVERARETAVAWVLVRDHSHAGAIGYYARRIADAGMMSVVMTASRPLMAYYGTRGVAASTNPLAIGTPGGWLLDMSSAAIAKGKILAAAAAGKPLPEGVASDADGNPTTDPAKAVTPLPLGGPKGAGLSVMIECLTSLALANPLIATGLSDAKEAKDFRQNGLVVAIDPAVISDDADLASATSDLDAALKTQPRATGFDEVLHPGERGDRMEAARRSDGIPIAAKTWGQLASLAEAQGLAMIEPLEG